MLQKTTNKSNYSSVNMQGKATLEENPKWEWKEPRGLFDLFLEIQDQHRFTLAGKERKKICAVGNQKASCVDNLFL